MPQCRMCGASCSHAELLDTIGCVNCNGSPDCGRCGHSRSDHSGTFGGGDKRCRVEVPLDNGSLSIGRCACPGYSAETDGGAVGVTDVQVLSLRPPAR